MSKISLFSNIKSTTPEAQISIEDFLQSVKLGTWRSQIEAIRVEPDKEKRKALKELLPAITASGVFSKRNQDSLLQHSGFICIDLDNFTDKTALLSDPYTFALVSSASGGGLAVFVKIDPSKHKESFKWLQEYFFKTYGIVCDPAPSNHASLRFVSYDPDCFVNEKSKTAKFSAPKQKKINSLPQHYSNDNIGQMIKEVVNRGINIAESYHEYLTISFALSAGLGEAGRSYFHAIAGVSAKYNSEHCDRQYSICLKKTDGGITIGSLYYILKQAGITFPENSVYDSAVRISAIAKKSNEDESETIEKLVSKNIPREDAVRIVKEVHKRPDITLNSIAADPERLIQSLVAWVESNYNIKKNIITGKLENKSDELVKEKFNTIYLHARASFNTPLISFDLVERVLFSEFIPEYNPIKEYISENRHRNTTGNIDRLIQSINTTTPGAKMFIRKWLLAIPAAVNGLPIRIVLALIGGQLTGKTEWFRRLLPTKLKRYYGESKLEREKDDELLMCQKLILMDDEMGGKSKTDEKRFKDYSSKDFFSCRAPYDKSNMDYKRLALLCGTSNETAIINDPTGNTRILPIEVISIDHELYNSVDKDELFMEIVRAYESGEDWNFTKEEVDTLSDTSEEYEGIHYERELILKFFVPEDQAEGNGFVEKMTASEIKDWIESKSRQRIMSLQKLGRELKNIFGERKADRKGGHKVQVYSVVKIQERTDTTEQQDYLRRLESIQNEKIGF